MLSPRTTGAYRALAVLGLEKFATTKYLRPIQRAFRRGNIEEAAALAREPGRLTPKLDPSVVVDGRGRIQHRENTYTGSALRELGIGQEHTVSLVAHPDYGVVVRKVRHPNSPVPPDQHGRVMQLVNEAPEGIFARRLGSERHAGSGAQIAYDEYVPGVNAEKLLKIHEDNPTEVLAISRERDRLVRAAKDYAEPRGYQVQDMRDANIVMQRQPDGSYRGKIIDPTAGISGLGGWEGRAINPPDRTRSLSIAHQARAPRGPKFPKKEEIAAQAQAYRGELSQEGLRSLTPEEHAEEVAARRARRAVPRPPVPAPAPAPPLVAARPAPVAPKPERGTPLF